MKATKCLLNAAGHKVWAVGTLFDTTSRRILGSEELSLNRRWVADIAGLGSDNDD